MQFILDAISDHESSEAYKEARDAEEYAAGRNVTITNYRKTLVTVTGKVVPDNYSANHKCASGFYERFTIEEVAHLLGNGVSFGDDGDKAKEKLGADFDEGLYDGLKAARAQSVCFGFYDDGVVHFFPFLEFVPLWDEESGALMAGIRYWRIDASKPLRCTLYELDGLTDYIQRAGEKMRVLRDKRIYRKKVKISAVDGEKIYDGENYPSFPIVPLWGNKRHESTLLRLREQIDCYDLIKSGFANDLDDASMIYWTLKNSGGMSDMELAEFVQRLKTVHVASVDGRSGHEDVQAHTVEVPHQSRETYLSRLQKDLYRDAMALDVEQIAAGNVTATQIEAAYDPLNKKCDEMEFCVIAFIQGLLAVAGVDGKPTFTRSQVTNRKEEVELVLSSAEYLDDEYITRKILTILGDGDAIDEVLRRKAAEDSARYSVEEQMGGEDENAATGENSGSGKGEE
jgi:hypothetical protein